MDKSYSLLYVDDEPDNLSTFRARFRKIFNIFTASSGKEGLEILGKHDIQVVISDQRMPEMTGIELLEEVKEKHPDVVRIILTAYTESEEIINAINKGGIYQYIKKPYVGEDLKAKIEKGLAQYSAMQRNKDLVKRLYSSVTELEMFYYRASTELQGHINSHQGLLDLAKNEKDAGNLNYFIGLLDSSAHRLSSALTELTDIKHRAETRIETGPIDFSSMLQSVLFHLDLERTARKIEVTTKVQPGIGYRSLTSIVYTLLEKLIENSIYTSDPAKSERHLAIDIRSDERNVIIEVDDNGIGSHESTAQILYVIHKAIGLLGGKIQIDSRSGDGTKAVAELPRPTKAIEASKKE